ncbi:hypothetical protein KBD20_02930 [Candidatus Saccharibacteria bacterium]|nr:hypothetical protein [Candidatus Saccharibacteria bacterium]
MINPEIQIDPSIFDRDHELEFSFALGGTAQDYALAIDIIAQYEKENSPEAKEGKSKALRQDPQIKEHIDNITNIIGEGFIGGLIDEILVESVTSPADESSYRKALITRAESSDLLIGYVFGYQGYMQENLLNVFDGDIGEALPASWSATWYKLGVTLHPLGGTTLAEVADFFDNLIHWQYADTYDHTDLLRGSVVAADISARTFYEEMEKHLTRSIVRRRDDWSS